MSVCAKPLHPPCRRAPATFPGGTGVVDLNSLGCERALHRSPSLAPLHLSLFIGRTILGVFGRLSSAFLYTVYVARNRNDDGIEGSDGSEIRIPSDLFVMSQAGKGHIPLLLWLQPRNTNGDPIRRSSRFNTCLMGGSTIRHRETKFVCTPRGSRRKCFRWEWFRDISTTPLYGCLSVIH
jgi:hypothetical protein